MGANYPLNHKSAKAPNLSYNYLNKTGMKQIVLISAFFVFMIISISTASAQNTKIRKYDSLIRLAKTDTARINLILWKLDVLATINLDSAISLASTALDKAQKIKFYKGEITLIQKLATNYAFKGNFEAASGQLKHLEKRIQSKDSASFASLYSTWGLFYGMQSKYDSSIFFLKKAIRIYERTGTDINLPTSYTNIAIGYQQQSNFPMAIQFQQKALTIYEKNKNESGQAHVLLNMATIYNNLKDLKRAESSFLKVIELAKKNQLNRVELYAYSNLATLYSDEQKWQKCYEYAIKAAEMGNKNGDQGIQAASLSKASLAMTQLNQFDKATSLSKRAIAIADSSKQPLNIFQAYASMGFALNFVKRWKEAIPYYEKGFSTFKDADIYTYANGAVFKELSECYEKTGNFSKALEWYKQFAMVNDSVRSRENIQKATEQTMNYEFEQKEQSAKVIQDAKDEVNRTRQIALIFGLILSVLMVVGAFAGYFGKRKANALLSKQKKEIEDTLTKLRNTQSQLIQSEKMASLGELTAGIAHEIQNPLNFVNNFSEVNTELIAELEEERKKEIRDFANEDEILKDIKQNEEKINHHGKRAGDIVKGMLQHSRSSSGIKEPRDINALADEYLRLSYHGLRAKDKSFNAEMKTDFDETIGKIDIIPQDIGRVLLNLYNNAFYAVSEKVKTEHAVETEHALPQGIAKAYEPTVSISTKKMGDRIQITVSDNGNGIPQNIVDKIFQPFFTTKPTGQGTGLGLSLSYDIVKAHGGELKVETNEEKGSSFIITIPVADNSK